MHPQAPGRANRPQQSKQNQPDVDAPARPNGPSCPLCTEAILKKPQGRPKDSTLAGSAPRCDDRPLKSEGLVRDANSGSKFIPSSPIVPTYILFCIKGALTSPRSLPKMQMLSRSAQRGAALRSSGRVAKVWRLSSSSLRGRGAGDCVQQQRRRAGSATRPRSRQQPDCPATPYRR
jgi:hypothetical protein